MATVTLEDIEMAKLSLMFEEKIVKEVPVGSRAVSIGRSPDNDLPVDNLAVSNYHARVYFEAGKLVVEDLDSLNGTFLNDMRVERATLRDGDSIWVGKHHIKVDASHDTAVPVDYGRKTNAPRINETMVLDTKVRREMLQQAAAMGERTQFAAGRLKVPTLIVLAGRTDQKEYALTNKLTVIGKSSLATVRRRCGQSSCRCAKGGPLHVAHQLTFKEHGKTRTVYVPKDLLAEVRSWIDEHKRLKQLQQEITHLTLALIRSHVPNRRRKRGRL